ncbi:LysR family transcriptional regulator [Brenneria izadpanahii]|uniref:LysR family transcriptional regulator n=1 Tax=Brenneria izadpanahii TaxID=2722756 RepID=A0ABX7UTB8_9GAMM|nr:LysR family transcriptional regulator [Brenneria izadpanahii]QTF08610.1 LysR family transcriptional regulator [Brenneria izadpanahii]
MNLIGDLPGLIAFERIASLGSFTAASLELGISLSVVSKRLANFEQRLGVHLLNRSTRKLSLTDEGRQLFTHAVRIIAELKQAQETLIRQSEDVSGVLKITAPNGFGRRRLVPLLAGFSELHPQIHIQLQLSDDVIDLISQGFDLALRYGELPDSSLIARFLAPNRRVLCASPVYLRRRGHPQNLADLAHHDCIQIGGAAAAEWRFDDGQPVRITARTVCNDGEAAHAMSLAGMGIVLKSFLDVADDLASGALVQVLPQHAVSAAPLNAVYPHGHQVTPRLRAFIDYMAARLAR